MKKIFKVLIPIILAIGILVVGLVILVNYNEKNKLVPIALKTDVINIVTRVNSYCASEDALEALGSLEDKKICTDGNTIINNISKIMDDAGIGLFEKILSLDYDGLKIIKIELKYKKQKYVYIFRDYNDTEIIVTDLDDYSYDYQENESDNDSLIDNELVESLYKKYISYATYETNNYKSINVNDSTSDEYLVKHAIYKILEDNKINIKDYEYNSGTSTEEYLNGYKITTTQIEQYIRDNFNIQRTIDYNNLELNFVLNSEGTDNADISYYYNLNENAYRLISDSSIPKTGAGIVKKYSKYNSHEIIGDELIIYTEFFLIGSDMGSAYLNNNMNNINFVTTVLGDIGEIDVQYVLDNYSNKIGRFKHVFKNVDGNYYWVSTTQTN